MFQIDTANSSQSYHVHYLDEGPVSTGSDSFAKVSTGVSDDSLWSYLEVLVHMQGS